MDRQLEMGTYICCGAKLVKDAVSATVVLKERDSLAQTHILVKELPKHDVSFVQRILLAQERSLTYLSFKLVIW